MLLSNLHTIGRMRINHHLILLPDLADGRQTIGMRTGTRCKTILGDIRPIRRTGQIKGAASIDLGPQFAHLGRITTNQIEDKALEVRSLRNIH